VPNQHTHDPLFLAACKKVAKQSEEGFSVLVGAWQYVRNN
jgi:hypothetical protein